MSLWRAPSGTIHLDHLPHLIRFGFSGGLSTLFQLAVLFALVSLGLNKGIAHAAALIASAQVSFFLSREVTWAERRSADDHGVRLVGKLARFNGMIAVSMLVNQLTFQVAAVHIEYLLAGALGVLVAAAINYTVSDRLIFAVTRPRQEMSSPHKGRYEQFE